MESGEAGPVIANLQSSISLLESLVDKNLLRQAETAGGEMRFSMLETVREFALERLAASGDEAALRERHAAWVSAFMVTAAPEIIGPRQMVWYGRVDAEMDNLRAAFDWLLTQGEVERAGELAANLCRFWFRRGYWREGRDRLLLILSRLSAAEVARLQGDYGTAEAAYTEALDLFQARGLDDGVAANQIILGFVLLRRGDTGRARSLFHESLKARQAAGDVAMLPLAVAALACLAAAEATDTVQAEQAARLFGAADALLAGSAPAEPVDQREMDHHRARLAGILDTTTFAATLAVGGGMTPAEAVDYALGEVSGDRLK